MNNNLSDVAVASVLALGKNHCAELDWERWFRRSITKSAAQITQAEDWIKRQPERVYLDVKATQRLPLALPPANRMRVHRILIALNASERCKAATGHPTLELSPKTVDDEKPFAVGRISDTNGWIHVFSETTLPVILSELSSLRRVSIPRPSLF